MKPSRPSVHFGTGERWVFDKSRALHSRKRIALEETELSGGFYRHMILWHFLSNGARIQNLTWLCEWRNNEKRISKMVIKPATNSGIVDGYLRVEYRLYVITARAWLSRVFSTKHLLIDWRWGEFTSQKLDFDHGQQCRAGTDRKRLRCCPVPFAFNRQLQTG